MKYHALNLRAEGLSDEEISNIITINEKFLTELEVKVYKFVKKACKEPARITDMEFNELKKLGLSELQIIELVSTIGLAISDAIWYEVFDITPPAWLSK